MMTMRRVMPAVLMMMALALAAVASVRRAPASAQDVVAPSRDYLDLTRDPVMPGGISAAAQQTLQQAGWQKVALARDTFAHVQFQDEEGAYYQDGWLRKGTEVYVRPFSIGGSIPFDFGVLQACGNPIILGEEKYGWH